MSDFIIDSQTSSVIGSVHALLEAVSGCQIFRGDMNTQRARKPFMVYNTVLESKYKRHQVMKQYSDYNGIITPTYKIPHKFDFQYTIVEDSQKLNSISTIIRNLSRYLISDKFKLAMDRLSVGFYMLSDITENNVPIEGFSDRQFIFQMRYFWADIWTDTANDATSGAIETVQFTETTPPVNG